MYVTVKPDLRDNFTPDYMMIFNCVALNLYFTSSFSIRLSKMTHKFSVYRILPVATSKSNLINNRIPRKNTIFTIFLYKVVDVADLNNNWYTPPYACVMSKIHKCE